MNDQASDRTSRPTVPDFGVLPRPVFQLRSLPIAYRWEVSRRHPYYQMWWQPARAKHRNHEVQVPAEEFLRQAAVVILAAIGVTGEPPDPSTEFSELESDELNQAWLTGALHPISFRGMAGALLAALPKEALGHVGMLMVEASCDDVEGEPPKKIASMLSLTTLDKPGLDDYADEPLVSINPAASTRQLREALETLLPEWKEDRGLVEQRSRADKYDAYLRVWDLREGWDGE